ncbi:MAG: hypothetical protein JRD68_07010 [Deltaproteobacteria bacterium]|nr:hypothetical protein [Deltaproteobacteria bacterium]
MALVEELTVPQSPEYALRVLLYEIGDISKCIIYKDRFGKTGYVGETKIACADAITQLKLLIEQLGSELGFTLEECERDGFERFQHRMQECKKAEDNGIVGGDIVR